MLGDGDFGRILEEDGPVQGGEGAVVPPFYQFFDVFVLSLGVVFGLEGVVEHPGDALPESRGDAALMRSFCERAGIGLTVVPPVRLADGTLVSSTSIRDCLASGNRRGAEEMLNRPLSVREEALLGGREHE